MVESEPKTPKSKVNVLLPLFADKSMVGVTILPNKVEVPNFT